MAAAIELARHGVRCTLLEEASRLGGVVYRGPLRDGVQLDYLGPRYAEVLGKLHGEFQEHCGLIDVHLNHRVVGAEGTRALVVLDADEQLHEIEYPQLLLSAGCHERSVPFPGWTLPGVILLGGLQLQIKSGVVKPQGPAIIAGTGPLLPLVATQLHASGVKVAGVYEACAFGKIARESLALLNKPQLFLDGLSMLAYLKLHGIAMNYGWGVVEAHGEGKLKSVSVAPYSQNWTPDMSRVERFEAQTWRSVRLYSAHATQSANGPGSWLHDDGYLRAHSNVWQQSNQPHIHLAGDRAGFAVVKRDAGRQDAATSILLQRGVLDEDLALVRRDRYLGKLKAIVRFRAAVDRLHERGIGQTALPKADTVICRCEHATRADIDLALEQGVQDIASLKMRTRVSMGDCQGRMCVGYCSDRLRQSTGRQDVGWLRPRFPIDPIPFSAFQSVGTEAASHE